MIYILNVHLKFIDIKLKWATGRFSFDHGYGVKTGRELDLIGVVVLPNEYNEVRGRGRSQQYKEGDDYVKP